MPNLSDKWSRKSHAITKTDGMTIRNYRRVKVHVEQIPINKNSAHDTPARWIKVYPDSE